MKNELNAEVRMSSLHVRRVKGDEWMVRLIALAVVVVVVGGGGGRRVKKSEKKRRE